MKKQTIRLENILSKAIYSLFIIDALGISIPAYRALMVYLIPFILMLTGMIVLFYELKEGNYGFFIWGLMVVIFILIIQSIGVKTGLLFGKFSFGNVPGAIIADVPVIIGINWLFIITAAAVVSSYAERGIFLTPLLVSVFIALFDLFLEPVAVKLGYWKWHSNIPLQNYYVWMLISYFISFTYYFYKVSNRSFLPVKYFFAQLLFFSYLFWVL